MIDKGNAGFLRDADAEWNRQAAEAERRDKWMAKRIGEIQADLSAGDVAEAIQDFLNFEEVAELARKNYQIDIGNRVMVAVFQYAERVAADDYEKRGYL